MNSRILAFALTAILYASCGQPSATSEKQSASLADVPAATIPVCDSFAIEQFAMDTTKAALLADSFLEFYRHDDAAGRFTTDEASIAIQKNLMLSFETLAPAFDPTTQCLGVRIAYGLDESARPLFLFAPVVMTRTSSEPNELDFRLGEPSEWYSPASGKWEQIANDIVQSAIERYASRTRKYVDGVLTPLRIDPKFGSASDPSSTFFPFTEFRALISENEALIAKALPGRNDVPSITAVRVRWAAETMGDDGLLKQVVVILPVLNGPNYPGQHLPLTLMAANFNHLCPANCDGSTVSYRARKER